MNSNIINKIIGIVREHNKKQVIGNRHFSFLIDKNKIISFGRNNYRKTHSLCQKLGYRFFCRHSEFDSFIKIHHHNIDYRQLKLVNIRINRFGKLGMAKPCSICEKFIKSLGITKVYYTNREGDLIFMKI